MKQLVFALALAGCASSMAPVVTPDPVIAAERAFAARAGEIGWAPAFAEFVAPDGQMTGRTIAPASEVLAAVGAEGAGRTLFWAPEFAGIARSGDLGFTAGAYSADAARTPRGRYFTVWRRQSDGAWKWIWDGGPGPSPSAPSYALPVTALPVAPAGAGAGALEQVRALEAAGVFTLAADGRRYLPSEAGAARYNPLRVEASEAGDMVFVLGDARWEDQHGFFARIWQRRPEGWRVVYDQISPAA